MPSRRSEIRKDRYDLARRLGYSSKEARAVRDWSAQRIRSNVAEKRKNLSAIPREERSESQVNRLRAIRRFERQSRSDVTVRAEIESRSDRYDNFREWSNRDVGFPAEFQRQINRYNAQAGQPEFSSFGYRAFYARYVEGMTETDALEYAMYERDEAL